MEAFWSLLALVGLRSFAARPFLCVLALKVLASYACVWLAHGDGVMLGYAATALVDIWALGMLAPARAWRWGDTVWFAQLAVVASQGMFWTGYAFGWYAGEQAFHIGRALFTLQLFALAWPGGVDVAQDFNRWRRARRHRDRMARQPRGARRVRVLGLDRPGPGSRRKPPC